MVSHKFAVGDRVRLTLDRYAESNPSDIHTISRKLPPEANICQYRVKRVGDGQERTVSEPQMVAVKADDRSGGSSQFAGFSTPPRDVGAPPRGVPRRTIRTRN